MRVATQKKTIDLNYLLELVCKKRQMLNLMHKLSKVQKKNNNEKRKYRFSDQQQQQQQKR